MPIPDVDPATSPWVQIGGWLSLASLVVVSIVKGWLRPKSSVDELVSQLEKRLQDRDDLIAELRKTNAAIDARNDMLAEQVRALVEVGHTSAAVISALPRATTGGR